MTAENGTDAVARELGRYQLVHTLGQGGMGEVFLAKITGAAGFEKPCIVKTILPTLLSDRQFLDRFHHEAKVLVHLVHSNIAQVYDMGEADGTYFMALEYVAGVDLSQLLEEVRNAGAQIPVPIALHIAARVAEGLGYAHRKSAPDGTPLGIVHRDVSPHNVMVGYEGEVKVIDFGLARSAARSRYTLPSTVMGKLGYMSPEQARAEPVDHRTDIYACGVVAWELLAGRPAFGSGTVGEMMAAMANPRIPSLCEVRPEIPPELDEVVRMAVAPDPANRYARADDFARRLNEQLIKLASTVGAEEVGQYVRTTCPHAFAAQRQLISKLSTVSTMKRTPIPLKDVVASRAAQTSMERLPRPPVPTFTADEEGVGATYVRPASEVIPAASPPRSRTPLIALAFVVVAAGAGTAGWWFSRTDPAPDPIAQATPQPPVAAAAAPPPEPAAEPAAQPPASAEAPPAAEPPTTAEAPAELAKPAEPEQKPKVAERPAAQVEFVTAPKVAALIVDRTGAFMRAGAQEGLAPGAVLQIVGKRERQGKRRLLGTATVLEVHPKLSRIALDDKARRGRGKKFVVIPERPAVNPPSPAVATAPPATASATVPATAPGLAARLNAPSPAAASSAGAALAPAPVPAQPAAPGATAPAQLVAPAAAAAPPAPKRTLQGRVTTGGAAMFRHLVIHNADVSNWTDCTLYIREDGKYPAKYSVGAPIAKGTTREVQLRSFSRDPSARLVPPNMVGVGCAEGNGEFPTVW